MIRLLTLLMTHGAMLGIGFALGIYMLPILTAPESPAQGELAAAMQTAEFSAEFSRDLKGSDFLHWGEGKVSVSPFQVIHQGALSPGPDYKLYLVPEFADDEGSFLALKDRAIQIGEVKTFNGFIIDIPEGIRIGDYTTVLVWCEAFGEFITAAKYQ